MSNLENLFYNRELIPKKLDRKKSKEEEEEEVESRIKMQFCTNSSCSKNYKNSGTTLFSYSNLFLIVLLLVFQLSISVHSLCVWQRGDGVRVACGFRQSGLFRLRNFGGVKSWAGLGFSVGDESGLKESLTNVERTETEQARSRNFRGIEQKQTQQQQQEQQPLLTSFPSRTEDENSEEIPEDTDRRRRRFGIYEDGGSNLSSGKDTSPSQANTNNAQSQNPNNSLEKRNLNNNDETQSVNSNNSNNNTIVNNSNSNNKNQTNSNNSMKKMTVSVNIPQFEPMPIEFELSSVKVASGEKGTVDKYLQQQEGSSKQSESKQQSLKSFIKKNVNQSRKKKKPFRIQLLENTEQIADEYKTKNGEGGVGHQSTLLIPAIKGRTSNKFNSKSQTLSKALLRQHVPGAAGVASMSRSGLDSSDEADMESLAEALNPDRVLRPDSNPNRGGVQSFRSSIPDASYSTIKHVEEHLQKFERNPNSGIGLLENRRDNHNHNERRNFPRDRPPPKQGGPPPNFHRNKPDSRHFGKAPPKPDSHHMPRHPPKPDSHHMPRNPPNSNQRQFPRPPPPKPDGRKFQRPPQHKPDVRGPPQHQQKQADSRSFPKNMPKQDLHHFHKNKLENFNGPPPPSNSVRLPLSVLRKYLPKPLSWSGKKGPPRRPHPPRGPMPHHKMKHNHPRHPPPKPSPMSNNQPRKNEPQPAGSINHHHRRPHPQRQHHQQKYSQRESDWNPISTRSPTSPGAISNGKFPPPQPQILPVPVPLDPSSELIPGNAPTSMIQQSLSTSAPSQLGYQSSNINSIQSTLQNFQQSSSSPAQTHQQQNINVAQPSTNSNNHDKPVQEKESILNALKTLSKAKPEMIKSIVNEGSLPEGVVKVVTPNDTLQTSTSITSSSQVKPNDNNSLKSTPEQKPEKFTLPKSNYLPYPPIKATMPPILQTILPQKPIPQQFTPLPPFPSTTPPAPTMGYYSYTPPHQTNKKEEMMEEQQYDDNFDPEAMASDEEDPAVIYTEKLNSLSTKLSELPDNEEFITLPIDDVLSMLLATSKHRSSSSTSAQHSQEYVSRYFGTSREDEMTSQEDVEETSEERRLRISTRQTELGKILYDMGIIHRIAAGNLTVSQMVIVNKLIDLNQNERKYMNDEVDENDEDYDEENSSKRGPAKYILPSSNRNGHGGGSSSSSKGVDSYEAKSKYDGGYYQKPIQKQHQQMYVPSARPLTLTTTTTRPMFAKPSPNKYYNPEKYITKPGPATSYYKYGYPDAIDDKVRAALNEYNYKQLQKNRNHVFARRDGENETPSKHADEELAEEDDVDEDDVPPPLQSGHSVNHQRNNESPRYMTTDNQHGEFQRRGHLTQQQQHDEIEEDEDEEELPSAEYANPPQLSRRRGLVMDNQPESDNEKGVVIIRPSPGPSYRQYQYQEPTASASSPVLVDLGSLF